MFPLRQSLFVIAVLHCSADARQCSKKDCFIWSNLELDCASYDDVNKTSICHEHCIPACMRQGSCDEGPKPNLYPLEWADTGCGAYPPTTPKDACGETCRNGTRCLCPVDDPCSCIYPGELSRQPIVQNASTARRMLRAKVSSSM